ncbi:hypothetical protein B0H19DRAFT_1065794 [Mycena capillaripes]|nr:hypothetical protein B0H19DRAFT_1065794 [Mycena capillaripes]
MKKRRPVFKLPTNECLLGEAKQAEWTKYNFDDEAQLARHGQPSSFAGPNLKLKVLEKRCTGGASAPFAEYKRARLPRRSKVNGDHIGELSRRMRQVQAASAIMRQQWWDRGVKEVTKPKSKGVRQWKRRGNGKKSRSMLSLVVAPIKTNHFW